MSREPCYFVISGFAEGVDLIAANIVIKEKMRNKDLFLEAAIPHSGRLKTKDNDFQELFKKCNEKTIIQDEYTADCFSKKNKYMVNKSDLLIAVWDERKAGGTYQTIKYAEQQEKEIKIIYI